MVSEHGEREDTLTFQVDLWSARGEFPGDLAAVATRHEQIKDSSRTRANTDQFRRLQRIRGALATLLEKLPDDFERERRGEDAPLGRRSIRSTTSYTSSIARSTTKATRRNTSSRVSRWRSTGTTTRCARCGIKRCLSGRAL